MTHFRLIVKYFAPVFFMTGYAAYLIPNVLMLVIGSVLIGIANGVGVPYLNTIASIKGGKNSATTVMPLLSAALYLGQFVSPIIVTPVSHMLFGQADLTGPYKVGILLCLVFLIQVYSTRHFQSLPPAKRQSDEDLQFVKKWMAPNSDAVLICIKENNLLKPFVRLIDLLYICIEN